MLLCSGPARSEPATCTPWPTVIVAVRELQRPGVGQGVPPSTTARLDISPASVWGIRHIPHRTTPAAMWPHNVMRLVLQVVKYGVVSMQALLQDLQHWSHLYVAGRLHKPVAVLASTAEAEAAYQHNLRAALSTALLLLPKPECSLKVRGAKSSCAWVRSRACQQ